MSLFEKIVKTIIVAVCMLFGLATIALAITLLKFILIILPTFWVIVSLFFLIVCPVVYLAWQYVEEQNE